MPRSNPDITKAKTLRPLAQAAMFYLGPVVVLLAGILAFLLKQWTDWSWQNADAHAAIELTCAMAGLAMIVVLVGSLRSQLDGRTVLASAAIVEMAILDGIHGVTPVGQAFVFLRALGLAVGGVLFFAAWIPQARSFASGRRSLVVGVAVATAALATLTVASPAILPTLLVGITSTTSGLWLNVAGGLLLAAAAPNFVMEYRRTRETRFYLFACLAALTGISGVLLRLTSIWDDGWWYLHVARLAAYLAGLAYVLGRFSAMLAPAGSREVQRKHQFFIPMVLIMLTMGIGMTLFSAIEAVAGEHLGKWPAQAIDIVFSSLLATGTAWFVLRKWRQITLLLVSETDEKSRVSEALRQANAGLQREILERQRAENSIRASREFMNKIISSIRDPIVVEDEQGRFVLANDAFCRMQHLAPQDVAGHTIDDTLPPEIASAILARNAQVLATGEAREFEEPVTASDNTRQIYLTAKSLYVDPSGNRFVVSVIRDITLARQAQEKLRFQNILLATQQEASIDGILVVDENEKIVSFNRRFVALWEIPAELIATGLDAPVMQCSSDKVAEPQLFRERVRFLYEHPSETSRDEIALRDGRVFDRYSAPMLGGGREYYGRVWYFRDITARKRAEEELERERKNLASVLEAAPVGMLIMDEQTVIVRVNDLATKLLGRSMQQMLHVRAGEGLGCVHASDSPDGCGRGPQCPTCPIRLAIESVTQSGQPVRGLEVQPVLLVHGAQSRPWIELNIEPTMIEERRHVIASIADITGRKKAQEELRQSKEAADAANHAKSIFLANMSHEIRTPMTAILGYAELSMDPSASASERQNYLSVIHRNGQHLLGLINDILDLSKIEAGKLSIEVRPVALASVLADVASVMRVRARQHGIALSVEYATAVPATVRTDGSRLRQILVNLVGNAIKFTERGGVRIVVSLQPQWRGARSAMQVTVIDTGVGIGQEKMAKLFQPFAQADNSISRKYGGTGLGLVISRRMAQLLGGELTASSQTGRGSTFTLTFPTGSLKGVEMLRDPAEAVRAQRDNCEPVSLTSRLLSGLRILLAEDGPDNQRLIVTVLQKAGAEVRTAENGRIALEAVRAAGAEGYHVILMDMQMPEMDGYEATRTLRQSGYSGPILALTAHAMAGDRAKCLDAGCDDHLAKPIDRACLIATIARFTGRMGDSGQAVSVKADVPATSSGEVIVSEYAEDPDLADILDTFVSGLPQQVSAMRSALANLDTERLRGLAHQLKGAGGSYGYPALTEMARTLEVAAQDADVEAANVALAELAKACAAAAKGRPVAASPAGQEATGEVR